VITAYDEPPVKDSTKSRLYFARRAAALKPLDFVQRHRFRLTLISLIAAFILVFFWDQILVSLRAGQQGVYWSRFFGGTSNVV